MKLAEEAKKYEPKATKNIADLELCNIDIDIYDVTATNDDGKEFTYKAFKLNDEEYRVPLTVIAQLKTILAVKPHLNNFKVKKEGEGLKTKYTVIPMD